jgi:hypothetical protein
VVGIGVALLVTVAASPVRVVNDDCPSGAEVGTGAAAHFTAPSAIVGDGAGNLYVADGHTIRKVAIATAKVSTVIGADGHVGVSLAPLPASLSAPTDVVVLPTGELGNVDAEENAVLIGHL